MRPFIVRAALLAAVFVPLLGSAPAAAASRDPADRARAGAPGAMPRAIARLVASPAAPGSAEPNLARGPDGRVWLTWIEPDPAPRRARGGAPRYRLRCAALSGDGWSPASTIAEGDSLFVNWADLPSLAPLSDGRLVAHWLWRNGSDPYAYEVRLSESRDGGSSWSRPVRAHGDVSSAEHGFVSMVPGEDGVHLVWLDGRKGAGKPEGTAETELRSARLEAAGSVVGEQLLDPRTCDCCPTAAVAIPGGVLVAYRDRGASEIRDISLLRLAGGRWSEPYPLDADGWTIAGCPVNGPSLAASGKRVVAAWTTGASDSARVLAAFSDDGGTHFGAPVLVDGASPLGRVQVMMLRDLSALVLWLGSASSPSSTRHDGLILARRVSAAGTVGPPVLLARTSSARASGLPRMARAGGAIVFAWTEAAPAGAPGARPAPKQIRVATASLGAFGGAGRK